MPAATTNQIVSLRESEQIIDALNQATDLEGGPEARVRFLLMRLRALLNRDGRASLTLLEDLDRQPAPQIVQRYVVRPEWDRHGGVGDEQVQELWNESPAMIARILPRVLAELRTPCTVVCSEDVQDKSWYQNVLVAENLKPLGYADAILSIWAATPMRALYASLLRREQDPPFSSHDRTLMSLMLRAIAPLADRELLRAEVSRAHPKITARQRDILLMLLVGDSEKEIAHQLHRSVHTVHTHVRQLYDLFEVSSRGQLMAVFVDRATVSALGAG